jgi:hypothetical protein
MPIGSVICRRYLDEQRENPWICECPLCREERKAKEALDKEAEEIGSKEEKKGWESFSPASKEVN